MWLLSGLSIVCCRYGEGSCERRESLDMFSISARNDFVETLRSEVENGWHVDIFGWSGWLGKFFRIIFGKTTD